MKLKEIIWNKYNYVIQNNVAITEQFIINVKIGAKINF